MHITHLLIFIILLKLLIYKPCVESSFLDVVKQFFTRSSNRSQEISKLANEEDNHMTIILKNINPEQNNIQKRAISEPLPICDDNRMMNFLAEFQVTNPESIINLSTEADLPVTCKRVTSALTQLESYLKNCTIQKSRDLYLQLTKGVAQFVDEICEADNGIRKRFLESYPCLKQLHSDFENCYGPADWTEDIKKKDICCAFEQISDCYFTKAAQVCGKNAAHSMKKVVVCIINAIIPVHCTTILDPPVHDPLPNIAATHSVMSIKMLIVVNIIISIKLISFCTPIPNKSSA